MTVEKTYLGKNGVQFHIRKTKKSSCQQCPLEPKCLGGKKTLMTVTEVAVMGGNKLRMVNLKDTARAYMRCG